MQTSTAVCDSYEGNIIILWYNDENITTITSLAWHDGTHVVGDDNGAAVETLGEFGVVRDDD